MNRSILNFAALAVLLLSPTLASAAIEYVGPPGGGTWLYPGGGSVGTEFTANVSADVIMMGIWDEGGDGLAGPHDVGLWDSVGNLITSVTIPAGTSLLADGYQWVTATASILAGQNYVLGAYYPNANDRFKDTAAVNPAFTLVHDLYIDGGAGLQRPTETYFNDGRGWYGPNLQVAEVPEPASLILWGLGGLGMAVGACRRRWKK